MAERDDDRDVSARYRELGRDEPPRALDEAIRAQARQYAALHPAPLVPPTGRRRWYFPVAAAAVLVLAVSLTWHAQREEAVPTDAAPMAAYRQEAKAMRPPAAPSTDLMEGRVPEGRVLAETPEQWLERIAKLRQDGRHEEADRELAEFRRRHPQFGIAREMLEKVERK